MTQGGPTNDGANEELYSPSAELHALEEDIDIPEEPPLLPRREPLRSIFKGIALVEQVLGAVLLFVLLGLTIALVLQRYFKMGWPGTGELARFMMVWGTFLVAGYLVAYPPGHITIAVVDYFIKGRWLGAFKLFADLVILGASLVVLYGGFQLLANDIGQTTPAAGLPLYWVNMIPVIGFALVAIRALLGIIVRDVPALLGREVQG